MDEPSCIFCRIGRGEIPSLKVLETSEALGFLDVSPLAPGHTLLIPKTHYESIRDVPAERAGSLCSLLPRLANAVMESTGASGMNILQNTGRSSGQAVFHLHFHLIPRREGDSLGYRWDAGSYAAGEAEPIRDRIISQLES